MDLVSFLQSGGLEGAIDFNTFIVPLLVVAGLVLFVVAAVKAMR